MIAASASIVIHGVVCFGAFLFLTKIACFVVHRYIDRNPF